MKEYLLLIRAGKPASQKSDQENKAEGEAWGAYMQNLIQKGQFGGGQPLIGGGKTISASGIVDQPVNAAKEGIVGGYLIIKAENFDEAIEIAKACPHLQNEGNIELREIAPMPAMG